MAAVIVCYPFLPVFWWWFVLRVLQGFFVSILFAISEAWIVKFAEGAWRSRILALYTSILALSFGGGPVLIGFTGIEGPLPFLVGAAVLLVATIPIFFVKDENVDSEDETPLSVLAFARKAPILLFAVGMFAIIDAANLSFLPVYAVKKGFDQETAAMALTAFIIGNTVLQFPIGWCADHFPKRIVMAVLRRHHGHRLVPRALRLRHLGAVARPHRHGRGLGRDLHRGAGRTGRALLRP